MRKLYDWLDLQPSEGAKGELFSTYRRTFMDDQPDVYTTFERPGPFRSPEFTNTKKQRQPDGAVEMQEVENLLPRGRYAIEDKTGRNAFDMAQAVDYAKTSNPDLAPTEFGQLGLEGKTGGLGLTPEATVAEYDGLVYVFSRRSEAEAALARLEKDRRTKRVLGIHPAGIHVTFFDEHGSLVLLSPAQW
jgi:hypothetical protein